MDGGDAEMIVGNTTKPEIFCAWSWAWKLLDVVLLTIFTFVGLLLILDADWIEVWVYWLVIGVGTGLIELLLIFKFDADNNEFKSADGSLRFWIRLFKSSEYCLRISCILSKEQSRCYGIWRCGCCVH